MNTIVRDAKSGFVARLLIGASVVAYAGYVEISGQHRPVPRGIGTISDEASPTPSPTPTETAQPVPRPSFTWSPGTGPVIR